MARIANMVSLGIKFKRCYRCERWAVLSSVDFHRNKSKSDGFREECKLCAAEIQRLSTAHRESVYRYAKKKRKERGAPKRGTVEVNAGLQRCTGCEEWKPLEGFYKQSHRKTGYMSKCIECTTKQRKQKEQA
jgi:hypothetical protein